MTSNNKDAYEQVDELSKKLYQLVFKLYDMLLALFPNYIVQMVIIFILSTGNLKPVDFFLAGFLNFWNR